MAKGIELARLVAQFGQAYTRRIWEEMERAGTTPARARLLMALQCQGSCKMGELSTRLGVTPRNVTKLVDGLEEEGLVTREADDTDRRVTIVRLTEPGLRVSKESTMASDAAAGVFDRLTSEQRQQLASILQRLLEVMAEEAGDGC